MNGVGYYVATLSATTGERIRDHDLFARGNGDWSFGDGALVFKRFGTPAPVCVPFASIRSVNLGPTFWAGKWLLGAKIVLVEWADPGGRIVVSGFVFSTSRAENSIALEELKIAVAGQ